MASAPPGDLKPERAKMLMENWAQQLVNAATIGGMYTLVAVGFTLFFGVLGLINFAHGEVFMLVAFAALFAAGFLRSIGVPAGWLLVVAMFVVASIFCGAVGMLTERLAYRRCLRRQTSPPPEA